MAPDAAAVAPDATPSALVATPVAPDATHVVPDAPLERDLLTSLGFIICFPANGQKTNMKLLGRNYRFTFFVNRFYISGIYVASGTHNLVSSFSLSSLERPILCHIT